MLIMLMLMLSCIDAIDHADSVGRQSAQVDKVEVGWEFELMTVAEQGKERQSAESFHDGSFGLFLL